MVGPRTSIPWALALALVSGCGGGAASRPVKPALEAGPPSAPSGAAAAIEPVVAAACEVRTEGSVVGEPRLELFASLADAAEGRALGRARYEVATFSLAEGDATGLGWVEASGYGMSLAALMRAAEVPLWVRPTRTIASGMITPGPRTRVALQRAGAGTLQVRLDEHELLDARRLPLLETVACADLQATPPAWSGSSHGKEIGVDAGKGLEILAFPGSSPEQGLVAVPPPGSTTDVLEARELERQGGYVRIEIASLDGSVRGWVRPEAVVAPQRPSMLGPIGGRPAEAPSLADADRRACESPLRFAALPDGRREPVWLGEVRPGTPIARDLGVRAIDVPGWSSLQVAGIEGRLVALTEALDACEAPSEAASP